MTEGLGLLFAMADGFDALGSDAETNDVSAHGLGPALTKSEVVITAASLIAMTFNNKPYA